jgi:2-keto-4-pentenoate hydratase/2-oxohepta-3-ene-1,7-dioic acid hydratase in catechol pathway
MKEAQARALAKQLQLKVSPDVWAYFKTAQTGKVSAVTNAFERLKKRSSQYEGSKDDPTVGTPVWQTLLEVELAVVIGRTAHRVPVESAMSHVAGYLVVNDLTARDRQVRPLASGGFEIALGPGKNFEGATRLAPWVTPAAEVGDPQQLALTTHVNGELRQSNSTRNMIHDVRTLVSFLSQLLELRAGYVISTGTPGGTGWGQDAELGGTGLTPSGCEPGRYLAAGDHVRSEIERVGVLEFDVAAADA